MSEPTNEFGKGVSDADRVLGDWLQSARAHQAPPELAATIRRRVAARESVHLPPEPLERIFGWIRAQVWRPVAIAALPLLIGLVVGWFIPQDDGTAALAQTLDQWSFADAAGEQDDDTLR
jgi:hypothetical protein